MEIKGNLSIGTPCHEDWGKMTPNEKGRFCSSCQKTVVDLRGKDQQEIKSIYVAHEGNLCGNMSVQQYRASREPAHSPELMQRLKVFAAALFAAFAFLFTSPAQAQSHGIRGKIAYQAPTGNLQGFARFEDGSLAKNTKLSLYKDGQVVATTTTSDLGHFKFARLDFGDYYLGSTDHLYYADHEAIRIKKEQTYRTNVTLVEEEMMMGDVAPIDIIELNEGEQPKEEKIDESYNPDQPMPEMRPECGSTIKGEIKPLETVEMVEPLEYVEISEVEPSPMILGQMVVFPEEKTAPEIEKIEPQTGESGEASLEVNGVHVTAYPNPAHSELYVRIDKGDVAEKMDLLLYDIDGKLLKQQRMGEAGATKMHIADYPAGMYILKVRSGKYSSEHKIIKL